MDHPDFDPYEVDADGLPLVYNEERIAGFWKGKPGMHMRLYDTQPNGFVYVLILVVL